MMKVGDVVRLNARQRGRNEALVLDDERLTYAGGTTLFVVASATAVLVLVTGRRPLRGPMAHVTAFFGRVSYGLYLWHFPVFWAVTRDGTHLSNGQRFAIAAAVTAAGTAASWFLVEQPALRLKGRSSRRARLQRAVSGAGAGGPTSARPRRP